MSVLNGLKVLEIAAIGPAPFCAMMLADMGADVVRVDRRVDAGLGFSMAPEYDVMGRGRRSVALDLKSTDDLPILRQLIASADVLIEGFRPGVMERLGLGPDECLAANPKLVYGRMTGWGQTGPLAKAAGHDLNYIALSGALAAIGPADNPMPPLNLVGDFGGGGMLLAVGVLAALLEARQSGRGQVVDAGMVDGATLLMASTYGMRAAGIWNDQRQNNVLDGAAPWYCAYRTLDGGFITIAAIEAKFYAELLERLELDPATLPAQHDRSRWPELRRAFSEVIGRRTRADWVARLEGTDVCFAPVLGMHEAAAHPHIAGRNTLVEQDGVVQPAPAPRFSRTPSSLRGGSPEPDANRDAVLRDWGVSGSTAPEQGS
jgi:alpha-methylacyl-CoA racemase